GHPSLQQAATGGAEEQLLDLRRQGRAGRDNRGRADTGPTAGDRLLRGGVREARRGRGVRQRGTRADRRGARGASSDRVLSTREMSRNLLVMGSSCSRT